MLRFKVSVSITSPSEKAIVDATALSPGEHSDILIDVHEMLINADEWLATPNSNYSGRQPRELIGTPEEYLLRETLRSAIYSGMA